MTLEVEALIRKATGANRCREVGALQSLWSGYGSILRYALEGAERASVIVKHVSPPTTTNHPRGWNTNLSHARKLKSYQVESAWYQDYAARCGAHCRVPECLAVETKGDEVLIFLEDLDASGYGDRRSSVGEPELNACIAWFAQFHANFLGNSSEKLWDCGTYWHLDTRPDELDQLSTEDPDLWKAATSIDAKLKASPFQTLVHGDAKLANFCFSPDGTSVAVVDFQYIGRGCGMKDLAYFIGSCFGEEDCEHHTPTLLDIYFKVLRSALKERGVSVDPDALEANWRALFPVAWTDFHRFLKGWSPGHWKIHGYSERLAQEVIAQLNTDHS
tara:strand:- start:23744 stop:24736 length:993 start_codon:yes stop_codon:yes gene_type:complete